LNSISIPLSWSSTFNTNTGSWANLTLTGTNIPSTRLYHTANLCKYSLHIALKLSTVINNETNSTIYYVVPNSQNIILYGGTNDGKSGKDY
jgi:hypothetical protein